MMDAGPNHVMIAVFFEKLHQCCAHYIGLSDIGLFGSIGDFVSDITGHAAGDVPCSLSFFIRSWFRSDGFEAGPVEDGR